MFTPKSSYSKEELVACGEGKFFDGEYPKLPLPPLLMFDRFTKISEQGGIHEKGEMIAELDINPTLWFFECHFKNDPVMPGCLGLDALWQMLGFYLGWLGHSGKGRALGCGQVKFTDQVLPDIGTIQYRLDFKRVMTRKLILGIADGQVIAKGKVIYNCENLKVGLFN